MPIELQTVLYRTIESPSANGSMKKLMKDLSGECVVLENKKCDATTTLGADEDCICTANLNSPNKVCFNPELMTGSHSIGNERSSMFSSFAHSIMQTV